MTRTIRRCLGRLPRTEVDDLVQDTLVQLLRAGAHVARLTRVQLDAYAATVARHTAGKWHTSRAKSPIVSLGLLAHVPAHSSNAKSLECARDILKTQWSALPPTLTLDQRDLVGCALSDNPSLHVLLERYSGKLWKVLRAARPLCRTFSSRDPNAR